MINNFLEDIKKAVNSKAYLSALALALILPDICGKREYDNVSKMENRDKYIKWFNEWVYKYVEIPSSKSDSFNKYDELVKFDGDVCYGLRNAFLHHGNIFDSYTSNTIRIDRLELCVTDGEWQFGDGHGCSFSEDKIIETHRRFNVVNLLNCFILGTQDYIAKIGDNSKLTGKIEIKQI